MRNTIKNEKYDNTQVFVERQESASIKDLAILKNKTDNPLIGLSKSVYESIRCKESPDLRSSVKIVSQSSIKLPQTKTDLINKLLNTSNNHQNNNKSLTDRNPLLKSTPPDYYQKEKDPIKPSKENGSYINILNNKISPYKEESFPQPLLQQVYSHQSSIHNAHSDSLKDRDNAKDSTEKERIDNKTYSHESGKQDNIGIRLFSGQIGDTRLTKNDNQTLTHGDDIGMKAFYVRI